MRSKAWSGAWSASLTNCFHAIIPHFLTFAICGIIWVLRPTAVTDSVLSYSPLAIGMVSLESAPSRLLRC